MQLLTLARQINSWEEYKERETTVRPADGRTDRQVGRHTVNKRQIDL